MFRPPATDGAIAAVEASLGLTFPPGLRALYRCADGQEPGTPTLHHAFGWMPLEAAEEAARFLNEMFPDGINREHPDHPPVRADPGVRPMWWWPGWMPFLENGGGDYVCVDLDPAEGGTPGQVVVHYHDRELRGREAPSVAALIRMIRDGLEAGRLAVVDGMITEAPGAR